MKSLQDVLSLHVLTDSTGSCDNLIPNPGFESVSMTNPGLPAWWSFENFYSGQASNVHLVEGHARTGSRCVEVDGGGVIGIKSAVFPVQPLRRYRLAFWVRIKEPKRLAPDDPERRVSNFCGDVTLKTFSSKGAKDLAGQGNVTRLIVRAEEAEWTEYSLVVTSGPDAAWAVAYLRMNAGAFGGCFLDDFECAPAPAPSTRFVFEKPADFSAIAPRYEEGFREETAVANDGVRLMVSPNLAPNPNFETDSDNDGVPDGWSLRRSDEQRVVALDSTRVLHGQCAVKMSGTQAGWTEMISDPVTLENPYSYTLSVNYQAEFGRRQGEKAGFPQMRLICGDGQDERILDLWRLTERCGWLRDSITLPAGSGWWPGASGKQVRISLRLCGEGAVWFDGVVLRKGRDRGAFGGKESMSRSGRVVSGILELGPVKSVKVSAEGSGVTLCTRFGPTDDYTPRTWSEWRCVGEDGQAFLPFRGLPAFMQWKAELKLEDGKPPPVLRRVVVETQPSALPSAYIELSRLVEGFIDREPMLGGWQAQSYFTKEEILANPEYVKLSQALVPGAATDFDVIESVRNRMQLLLVLYNAYEGGGRDTSQIELCSQGTGIGCGDVNHTIHETLQNLGIPTRRCGGGSLGGGGHSFLEAWSNQWNKWVMLDAFYGGVFFKHNGIPLSLTECWDMWRDDRLNEVEMSCDGSALTLMYRPEIEWKVRSYEGSDYNRKRNGDALFAFLNWHFCPRPYVDAPLLEPNAISVEQDGFTTRRDVPGYRRDYTQLQRKAIEFKINQTELVLDFNRLSEAEVKLDHNMPHFDHFERQVDPSGAWQRCEAEFVWTLANGANYLRVRAVSAFGLAGPAAGVDFFQRLPLAEPARTPAVPLHDAPWRVDRRFRLPLLVTAGLYERIDDILRVRPDLSRLSGVAVNPDSIRVVAELPDGTSCEAPFSLSGDAIDLRLAGVMPIMSARRLDLYFDENPASPAQSDVRWERPNWIPNGDFESRDRAPFAVPDGVTAEIVTGAEGRRSLRITCDAKESKELVTPLFRIQGGVPAEFILAAQSTEKAGSLKIEYQSYAEDKQPLPSLREKTALGLSFPGRNSGATRTHHHNVTHPNAAWACVKMVMSETSAVVISELVYRRRHFPEAAPIRAEAGALERRES